MFSKSPQTIWYIMFNQYQSNISHLRICFFSLRPCDSGMWKVWLLMAPAFFGQYLTVKVLCRIWNINYKLNTSGIRHLGECVGGGHRFNLNNQSSVWLNPNLSAWLGLTPDNGSSLLRAHIQCFALIEVLGQNNWICHSATQNNWDPFQISF